MEMVNLQSFERQKPGKLWVQNNSTLATFAFSFGTVPGGGGTSAFVQGQDRPAGLHPLLLPLHGGDHNHFHPFAFNTQPQVEKEPKR